VDDHFEDGAGSVSHSLLPKKAANNQFMTMCNLWPPRWRMIDNHQLLTFRWRSFWRLGREGIAFHFAYNGSQRFLYDWLHSIGGVNTQDALSKIVDDALALIFKRGQGGYCYLYCRSRQPKIAWWLTATDWWCDFPGCIIKHCWSSIDAHFQDQLGSVLS